MKKPDISELLRWILYIIRAGTLVSSGIYLRSALFNGFSMAPFLKAVMFFLLGIFFTLMHGESNRG